MERPETVGAVRGSEASAWTVQADVAREGTVFARYLLGVDASPAVLRRYASACRNLSGEATSGHDQAVVQFIRRHPWSLPYLDAASGWLRRESLLRKRLLVMLSLLETTPEYADRFVSRPGPRGVVIVRIALWAASGILKLALGLLLYPVAGSTRWLRS